MVARMLFDHHQKQRLHSPLSLVQDDKSVVAQVLVALQGDTSQGLQHAQPQIRYHHLH